MHNSEPMHRQKGRISKIKTGKIRKILEEMIFDVENICAIYFAAISLDVIGKNTDVLSEFGDVKLSLSDNFGEGPLTTTARIREVLSRTGTDEYLFDLRNYLVVSFCNTFEKSVRNLGETCEVAEPKSGEKYQNIDGTTYDTKIINYWMRIYADILSGVPKDEYFTQCVNNHAVNYWQSLYRARNRIVHFGAASTVHQANQYAAVWGCRSPGEKIRTEHNKIDDVAQFFDNSFCHFLYDVDASLCRRKAGGP